MNTVGIAFFMGVLSSVHCLGMCGGFVLHLSNGQSRAGLLARQLLWQAGKTTTYIFLGSIGGFLGLRATTLSVLPWWQNVVTYLAGGFLILMALVLLGLIPWRPGRDFVSDEDEGLFASFFRQFFHQPTASAAFVLGLTTGFLPCPIVWGGLALALKSRSVVLGMATMAALGLGTAGSLLLLGLTGYTVQVRFRKWGATLGGIFLLLLGLTTVGRGTELMHRVLGCAPIISQQRASSESPCCHVPINPKSKI